MELQSHTTVTIAGYKIYEYLLVLNPHDELQRKITNIKKEFCEKYKMTTGTGIRPYLALVNFLQYEMAEERIVNRLQVVAMGFYPVKIELKGFGSFPSHTIYVNVVSKLPVQSLIKEVRSSTRRLMKLNDDNKPHFMMEPHMTIARKLQPWQYEKGWMEYSNKNFSGRFIADAMLLLKRPLGEVRYQIVRRFEFQNVPVTTKQGELLF